MEFGRTEFSMNFMPGIYILPIYTLPAYPFSVISGRTFFPGSSFGNTGLVGLPAFFFEDRRTLVRGSEESRGISSDFPRSMRIFQSGTTASRVSRPFWYVLAPGGGGSRYRVKATGGFGLGTGLGLRRVPVLSSRHEVHSSRQ